MVFIKRTPAKIRRSSIRLKSNQIPYIAWDEASEYRRGDMLVRDAHALAIQGDGEMIHGYAIVTWDKTGRRENAYNWRDQHIICAHAIPQFVADSLKNALMKNGHIDGF